MKAYVMQRAAFVCMSDVGLVRETCTSQVLTSKSLTNSEIVSLVPSNRGPTYLRCCVFLI